MAGELISNSNFELDDNNSIGVRFSALESFQDELHRECLMSSEQVKCSELLHENERQFIAIQDAAQVVVQRVADSLKGLPQEMQEQFLESIGIFNRKDDLVYRHLRETFPKTHLA
jgi:hypothetical protein